MKSKSKALAVPVLIGTLLISAYDVSTISAQGQAKRNTAPVATGSEAGRAGARPRANLGPGSTTASQVAARYFDSIKNDPPLLLAFLKAMPKGADLHNHMSGAVFAEDYIKMALANQLCVNPKDNALAPPPCAAGQRIDQVIAAGSANYDKLIDAWSMRNWQLSGESGHDHFFSTFGKFGAAIGDNTFGEMLASVLSQAARDRVSYVELMLTPNSGGIRRVAQGRWNDDFGVMTKAMMDGGLGAEVKAGLDLARQVTADARKRMGCGTPEASPGCSVELHFLFQGQRGSPRDQAFGLFLAGFEMAMHPENRDPQTGKPLVVGINLVQPEDSPVALQDFHLQMGMLDYLHKKYPAVHIALHAGELAPGLVSPSDLGFHIRESVERGHAERIGHGVDVMSEDRPHDLLAELAGDGVAMEICLSSNDLILGVRGRQHPLSAYIKYGVPVLLATDDEGVARSSMTQEYIKAVEDQGLDYQELKTMARTSLQYSFADGKSLWKDARRFVSVDECQEAGAKTLSKECSSFLKANKKAELQWRLEQDFAEFESKVARETM
jgi:adenosine deaminase/adenosine deaminase CECR1